MLRAPTYMPRQAAVSSVTASTERPGCSPRCRASRLLQAPMPTRSVSTRQVSSSTLPITVQRMFLALDSTPRRAGSPASPTRRSPPVTCPTLSRPSESAPEAAAGGRRLRLFASLQRPARFAPRLHAAVQGHGRPKSHLPQRRRRERRDSAELTVHDDPARRIGELLVDTQFQLSARQQLRSGNMALLKSVAFAHVEHDQLISARLEARIQFGGRHEWAL